MFDVVAFDADDTMWINEPYFQQIEEKFCKLLEDFATRHNISQELLKTEIQNILSVFQNTLSVLDELVVILCMYEKIIG